MKSRARSTNGNKLRLAIGFGPNSIIHFFLCIQFEKSSSLICAVLIFLSFWVNQKQNTLNDAEQQHGSHDAFKKMINEDNIKHDFRNP
ncbi:hypothetical protein WN943_020612 [Citrus x changshan-huyou]